MFKSFSIDRPFIENKYHDTSKPFDPFHRMEYHGWDCPKETGLSEEEIISGLKEVAKTYTGCSHEVKKARAVEFVLENTRIDINEHDYFPLIYTWNRQIKHTTIDVWNSEVFNEFSKDLSETYQLFNASKFSNMWPDFDHVVPDWNSILALGFNGLKKRANDYKVLLTKKQGALTEEQTAFFDGIEIEYSAIINFIDRLYNYAKTKTHEKAKVLEPALKNLKDGAPTNTFEALLIIYIYFFISESIDFYQVRSLGNGLDNSLYPFYIKDLENGTFNREKIKEFLAYFFMQWSAIGNYWGQPFYLGGTDKDGKTKINGLSYDILDTYLSLKIFNPKIQIKYSSSVPTDFLNKILTAIKNNEGSFVFCCEKGMRKALKNYGATEEETIDFDIRGCYETGVRANEVCTAGAHVNLLKAVEYVFSNGYDKHINKQVGLKTGDVEDFTCFNDFYSAFISQLCYAIDVSIKIVSEFEKYLGYINPSSLYSATIAHSLKQGKDAYQSGVKYNNSTILCCAFASAVDSIMATYELVYEKGVTTLTELKNALNNDWNGYEKLQLIAKNAVHKYGSNDDLADTYAKKISQLFLDRVANKPNSRGGVFKPVMHSARQFITQGEKTLATPDGRNAGEETSKNASPSNGADKNGATALILSALCLKPPLFTESFCLDVMLHPSAVSGEDGLIAMKTLIDVYEKNDGQSIQFNVFNADTLKDALAHPEKYKNLQVRVAGWNALFTSLSTKEQEAYIKRAENISY